MAKKKTKHAAQQRYAADKAAAGEHIQINTKFKTAPDVAMVKTLRERFPDKKDPAIVRIAMKLLAAQKN